MKNVKDILLDLDQIISNNTQASIKIEDEREAAEKLLLLPQNSTNIIQQVFSQTNLTKPKDKQ